MAISPMYSDLTLAAGSLHRDLTVNGKKQLKQIAKMMPATSTTIIQFTVTSDSLEEGHGKIYNAALVCLRKTTEKAVDIDVRICEYRDGEYKQLHQPLEDRSAQALQEEPQTGDISKASSQPIQLRRYPVYTEGDRKILTEFQAAREHTDNLALQIATLVLPLTSAGLVLPQDRRFHHLAFTVRLLLPREEKIQWCGLASWIRGLRSPREERNPGRTNFCGNITTSHGDWEKEKKEAENAIQAAIQGDVSPPGIPVTAQLVHNAQSQARIGAAAPAIQEG